MGNRSLSTADRIAYAVQPWKHLLRKSHRSLMTTYQVERTRLMRITIYFVDLAQLLAAKDIKLNTDDST